MTTEASDGTIWVTTRGGVAWYDGYVWHAAPDLPAVLPLDLAVDADGQVVALVGGNLWYGDKDGFEQIPSPPDSLIACESIPDGGVLLLRARRADGKVPYHVLHGGVVGPGRSIDTPKGSSVERRFLVSNSTSGRLWLATRTAVFAWSTDGFEKIWKMPDQRQAGALVPLAAAGTSLVGISYPMDERGFWRAGPNGLEVPIQLSGRVPLSGAVSATGNVAALFSRGEVLLRQGEAWTMLEPLPEALTRVNSFFFDADGNLWSATDSGLYLYHFERSDIVRWEHGGPAATEVACAYLAASDGSVWIGTGLGVEKRHAGAVERFERIDGVDLYHVSGLEEDPAGNIWISGRSGSHPFTFRWDGSTWRSYGAEDGLTIRATSRIRRDLEGRLWFLEFLSDPTDPYSRLFVYADGRFERWHIPGGPRMSRVTDFVQAEDGSLWFSGSGGISRLRDDEWRHWSVADGLRHPTVNDLVVDREGKVWFGQMLASGLGLIDLDDRVSYHQVGLPEDSVRVESLALDPEGVLWVGTSKGLWSHIDGEWTGTPAVDGLHPDRVSELLPLSDRVLIGGHDLGTTVIEREPAIPPARIEITPIVTQGRNALFEWTVVTFRGLLRAERVPTRWRLDDGAWSQWSPDRRVDFPHLDFGEHVFEVESRHAFSRRNHSSERTLFDVSRPLHRYLGIQIAAAAIVLLSLSSFGAYLQRRRKELNRIEEDEARFRQLAESVHGVFWLMDWKTRLPLYVSPAFERFWGRPVEDAMRDTEARFAGIHPDDRDRVRSAFVSDAARGTYDETCRVVHTDGSTRWIRDRAFPILDRSGIVYRVAGLSEDVTDLMETSIALGHSEQRFRTLVDTVPEAIFVELDGKLLFANPASARLLGLDDPGDLVGGALIGFLRPEHRRRIGDQLHAVGESGISLDWTPAQFEHLDGQVIDVELSAAAAVFDGAPAVQVIARDVTARKRSEDRQARMIQELDHRVKNSLATVLALAQQSGRSASSFEAFQVAFDGRVRAMARAHEALAATHWNGVALHQIASLVTQPFMTGETHRVQCDGPNVVLRARAATPIAMVLHELMTNAAKHGSLSKATGTVLLSWSLEDESLSLCWQEQGGPRPEETSREQTGMTVLRGMIEYELAGSVEFEFSARGLVCHMSVCGSNLEAAGQHSPGLEHAPGSAAAAAGDRPGDSPTVSRRPPQSPY